MNSTEPWVRCLQQDSEGWHNFLAWLQARSAAAALTALEAPTWEVLLRLKGKKEALDDLYIELTALEREETAQREYRARTNGT